MPSHVTFRDNRFLDAVRSEYERVIINAAEISPQGTFKPAFSAFSCSSKVQNIPRVARAVRPAALAPGSLQFARGLATPSEPYDVVVIGGGVHFPPLVTQFRPHVLLPHRSRWVCRRH